VGRNEFTVLRFLGKNRDGGPTYPRAALGKKEDDEVLFFFYKGRNCGIVTVFEKISGRERKNWALRFALPRELFFFFFVAGSGVYRQLLGA